MKELPIAFNSAAATGKEFEDEYDFKRPLQKEKDRKKTIVLSADSKLNNDGKEKETLREYLPSQDQVNLFQAVHCRISITYNIITQ